MIWHVLFGCPTATMMAQTDNCLQFDTLPLAAACSVLLRELGGRMIGGCCPRERHIQMAMSKKRRRGKPIRSVDVSGKNVGS